jgi:hypothetical protein
MSIERYKLGAWGRARADFEEAFHVSIQKFYDGFVTGFVNKYISIDPFKFDDYLHEQFGEYEKEKKSMRDIILEKYGERALTVFEALL